MRLTDPGLPYAAHTPSPPVQGAGFRGVHDRHTPAMPYLLRVLLLGAWCVVLGCQGAAAAAAPAVPEPIFDVPWQPIDPDLLASMQAQDWPAVVKGCEAQLARQPHNGEVIYQLACALARLGRAPEAVATLDQARRNSFGDGDRAFVDPDLQSLHGRPDFEAVLARMRQLPIGGGAPLEPVDAVPGERAIDGDGTGMLHYRLLLPLDADAAHPYRLVVWMHPSGGSCDALLERLAPDLARHHCCVVLFPKKQYVGWSMQERRALPATIAALARQPGVDARAPILMCFSAGGQAALLLWNELPKVWGGLILDASYPIDIAAQQRGQRVLMQVSPEALAARTPILALIGADDGNLAFWTAALEHWTKQRITLVTVPHAGHQFLFVGPYWAKTLAWLDHPGAPAAAPGPIQPSMAPGSGS